MKENIFKDMMEKAAKKDAKRNQEVGKLDTETKTKIFGVGTLIAVGIGVYLLYRMDASDIKYKRV